MESVRQRVLDFSVALEALGITPSGRLRYRAHRRDEKPQPRTPAVIYVPSGRKEVARVPLNGYWPDGQVDFIEAPGLADLTWSPPENHDRWRAGGYYWVSFWSQLEEVCHWDHVGKVWRSTGDEREWTSNTLDRVWEQAIIRQR